MKHNQGTSLPRLAYLVRCWPVETEHGPVWRASIENPYSAERHNFADLNALFSFLQEKTASYTQNIMDEKAKE